MKAIGYQKSLPAADSLALQDITRPEPVPGPHDLVVEIRAISVNPVDTKVRRNTAPAEGEWKILGWDAAGIVRATGSAVTLFKPGDRVWYAGDLSRPGTNAELHLVDERIVGPMPACLDFAAAAALPLTSITAWELLFDRLQIPRGGPASERSLLIIGAAGGVGSIMVQLAAKLTGLQVIGTASRPETQAWIKQLGAHQVIDHTQPFAPQLAALGVPAVHYVASLTHTDQHFAAAVDCLAPQGKFGLIDDPAPIDIRLLKRKSISLHWELMFTRPLFQTPDMVVQHHLLAEVSAMVDAGQLTTTLGEHFGTINAANLRRAHAQLESGKTKGKIVLAGF